jgi:hypothetical protein
MKRSGRGWFPVSIWKARPGFINRKMTAGFFDYRFYLSSKVEEIRRAKVQRRGTKCLE